LFLKYFIVSCLSILPFLFFQGQFSISKFFWNNLNLWFLLIVHCYWKIGSSIVFFISHFNNPTFSLNLWNVLISCVLSLHLEDWAFHSLFFTNNSIIWYIAWISLISWFLDTFHFYWKIISSILSLTHQFINSTFCLDLWKPLIFCSFHCLWKIYLSIWSYVKQFNNSTLILYLRNLLISCNL
jgi:hypothetical protein